MSIGMTYEQYWYGDVRATKAFVEADKLRQDRMNTEAWLQAMYVYDAVSRLFPIPVGFIDGKKSNIKPKSYMENPYPLFHTEEKLREQSEQEKNRMAEEERKKAIAYFNSFARNPKKLDEDVGNGGA